MTFTSIGFLVERAGSTVPSLPEVMGPSFRKNPAVSGLLARLLRNRPHRAKRGELNYLFVSIRVIS